MNKQTADFTAVAAEGQKQALAAITHAHESMLRLAELSMNSIPTATPSAASLPKPIDLVQASYDFAGKLLVEQRSFALKLTEIASAHVDEGRKTVAQAVTQK